MTASHLTFAAVFMLLAAFVSPVQAEDARPVARVFLDTGDPLYVVTPGQEDRVELVIENPLETSVGGTVAVRVKSYDGREQVFRDRLQIPARGRQRRAVPAEAIRGSQSSRPALAIK